MAFEYLLTSRAIVAAEDDKVNVDELRKPMQALMERQPKSGAVQWGVHDKKAIERSWVEDRRKAGET